MEISTDNAMGIHSGTDCDGDSDTDWENGERCGPRQRR